MKVAYLHRKPFPGQRSIERVFRNVEEALPENVEAVRFECPYPTKGLNQVFANARAAASVQADILHIVGDVHYLALSTNSRRTILTVHDMVGLRRLKGSKRALFKTLWYTMPARRAAVVTAISAKTREELERELPFLRGQVRVIPNPVDPVFQPFPKPRTADMPTILQVGTGHTKNVERLLKAIQGIRCRLILVGRLSEAQLRLTAGFQGELITLQGVTDHELLGLYKESDLVTFASTYEGFGLPIIEAQSVGRPVVTSRIQPMLEVSGGAAVYVDPLDVGAIRHGIETALNDGPMCQQLVAAGYVNVRRYKAGAVASQYAALYEEVADESPNRAAVIA